MFSMKLARLHRFFDAAFTVQQYFTGMLQELPWSSAANIATFLAKPGDFPIPTGDKTSNFFWHFWKST